MFQAHTPAVVDCMMSGITIIGLPKVKPGLTDEESDALARVFRDTTDADHYPLSPRVQMWKGILTKMRPEPPQPSLAPKGLEPKPELLPALNHYEPPRAGRYRRR
jgi:hypothetical protein